MVGETVSVTVELPKGVHGLISELVQIDGTGRSVEGFIVQELEFHVRENILADTEYLGTRLSEHLRKKHGIKEEEKSA